MKWNGYNRTRLAGQEEQGNHDLNHQTEERSQSTQEETGCTRQTRRGVEHRRGAGFGAGTCARAVRERGSHRGRGVRYRYLARVGGRRTAGTGGDQADGGRRTLHGGRDEADLRHGDGVGRVGDCCAGHGGGCGDGSGGCGGVAGAGAARGWGRDGRDEGDGRGDGRHDAWVLVDPGGTDTGEVGHGGLDLGLGCAPGLDAGDDLLGELFVRAEALGIAVGGALGC